MTTSPALHARLAAAAEARRPARRRLSDGRLPGRLAADRRDARRAGARGVRNEGHDAVLQNLSDRISPECCTPRPAWTPWRTNSTSISPDVVTPSTFRWIGSSPKDFAAWSSATWPSTSATAPPPATAPWPDFRVQPKAVRAVGTTCATNPIPVVVPCHRVVRSDGTMGGYRGGPIAKRALLDLEAIE